MVRARKIAATNGKGQDAANFLIFNGATTTIDCGSDASLDDLPDNAFTAEGWYRQNASVAGALLLGKFPGGAGWKMQQNGAAQMYAVVDCAVTDATIYYNISIVSDGKWHHIALTWDDAGDRKSRLWVDGALVFTSGAAAGAYASDAAINLLIGAANFDGAAGWQRLSNVRRYTAPFDPPSRFSPPEVDGNTAEMWPMNEGTGNTAVASVNSPANDGTVANGEWGRG